MSRHFSATGDIKTIFLTLPGLSTATLGVCYVPSLCPISVALLVALTSGAPCAFSILGPNVLMH